jgi:epoxide hydrolase-like predicted phosphatase
MLAAIRALRREGRFRAAALTNNWVTFEDHDERSRPLRDEFDVFVESCRVGMRKPEPAIYRLVCERLDVAPDRAVFLDDIGTNLKAARALGMRTIKVEEPRSALAALGTLVGLPL